MLKMKAAGCSKMMVHICQTTWYSAASLRTVIYAEKLNYLLEFYDLKLFYLCSASGIQGATWP
jgi:hypothetical protein